MQQQQNEKLQHQQQFQQLRCPLPLFFVSSASVPLCPVAASRCAFRAHNANKNISNVGGIPPSISNFGGIPPSISNVGGIQPSTSHLGGIPPGGTPPSEFGIMTAMHLVVIAAIFSQTFVAERSSRRGELAPRRASPRLDFSYVRGGGSMGPNARTTSFGIMGNLVF